VRDYLAAGPDFAASYRAIWRYDLRAAAAGGIAVPTLLIGGTRDRIAAMHPRAQALLPAAEAVTLDGATDFVAEQEPERFARCVTDFIARQRSAGVRALCALRRVAGRAQSARTRTSAWWVLVCARAAVTAVTGHAPRLASTLGATIRENPAMDEQAPDSALRAGAKTASRGWRPARCERVALVLQGGGASAPTRRASTRRCTRPRSRSTGSRGVSIGAINRAIIAGNPPERRLATAAHVLGAHHRAQDLAYTPDGDIYRKARNA
jgi:predicted acylesterase/phospholipase RssA